MVKLNMAIPIDMLSAQYQALLDQRMVGIAALDPAVLHLTYNVVNYPVATVTNTTRLSPT
jgi:hypothetical protein